MKISAEGLELRRKDCCVGLVDLLSGVSSSSVGTADRGMRILDFVQSGDSLLIPSF